MSKPGLSFGLNLGKKSGPAKARPPPRKAAFGGGDDSDDEAQHTSKNEETITELDGFTPVPTGTTDDSASSKHKKGKIPQEPPKLKSKVDSSRQFGDLSSALTSKKYAEAAEALDPSVYDYDAAHDVIEAAKKQREAEAKKENAQRKSRYMSDVTKAAEQRERDRSIAELKKIQREREAEGDEFADKEKFVTEAYKRKQEEDRIAEAEEKKREEEEKKKNKFGGMTGFHKELLEREDQRRAEMEKIVAQAATTGGLPKSEEKEPEKDRTETDAAREINAKGGSVVVNEDGEVVDKRQLLKGGLNLGAKKKTEAPKDQGRSSSDSRSRDQSRGNFGSGGKQAMRERQTRMLEEQLEQSLKRAREEEEEERKKVEQETKSRKTESDISSAKERYLARKRAAEEAKKNAPQDGP
ncbi:coiled-coil domain-containing protein 55 [Diaporthe eres]|uniref:Nuclear speckle splicing regulatory protein 1 N-terminal domain-containing protein n=1 Tax=Diaporthe vaccinii TaxID=105482 RepID=A0ABR4DS95_9PEZI|nr:coiled-coil domain-containing protein 55 [Diaporthe eres]